MTAEAMKNFSLSDAVITSVIGFAIVFFVLIILMYMIQIMRGVVAGMEAGKSAAAPAAGAAVAAASNSNMVPAKGSVGDVKLHDVPDRTAAILMAIVADKLEAPLNTLRFISIREKK